MKKSYIYILIIVLVITLVVVNQKKNSKIAIVINVNAKSRKDLGRPTTTPIYNKEQFQEKIRCNNESYNI